MRNACPRMHAIIAGLVALAVLPKAAEAAELYFPPPESAGGWRILEAPDDIRRLAGADPSRLDALREWLLQSDNRDFAAVVIRRGYIVLEVERRDSAKTDSRRVASVSKAVCATVLAIASERSQHGLTPRKMKFDDPAFDYIPWAQPLSDPRKASITVRQLLNHTSGICPEATGAPNDGTWEYVLGHSGDARTATLAFDPGTACGYSTHALDHAALVCETVTGQPYDQFAIQALFKPLGIEHWWFQYCEGGENYGRHPSHGLGMPARDLARIAYCMLRGGRWRDQQVIPQWFVDQTAAPTHEVKTPELRWKFNPQIFSHGWELPARHWTQGGRSSEGIPADARDKPGSGGQLIAFVPSLDLVVVRQTGSSGEWQFEEYLRRACATVSDSNAHDLPELVEADYIESPKIASISRFRSAAGHDYSDSFESCRSMKHYFKPGEDIDWSSVKIFSPVAGVVLKAREEWAGTKIEIQADKCAAFTFIIFHVKPNKELRQGDKVAAGQALGFHSGNQTCSDIAVSINTPKGRKLVSYFEVMPDRLFERYRARGLASREAVIISKAERDADPLMCQDGEFTSRGHGQDWIALSRAR